MDAAEDFLGQQVLAVAGVSRSATGYGYKVWKHLKSKGRTVYAINPNATTIDGERAYASVGDLPEPVGGVVCVVPPEVTLKVVQACIEHGVPRIWMQPGSESAEAVALAQEHGIDVIAGQCLLLT
jgi:predicted CoA-binding protein